MNSEFQEKLKLYKEGKLNKEEVSEIESSIDKFIAISDYLNNDEKDFFEELKQQNISEGNITDKSLKLRINLRIILLTISSVIFALLVLILLFFTTSKITTSIFGLNYKESFVKREVVVQFAEMFIPQYKSNESSVSSSPFAQQNISVFLKNTVGNTKIDTTEINVKYSFGKPVKSKTNELPPLISEEVVPTPNHESDTISGFEILENAPFGTKSKIFIEFNRLLSAEDIKEKFINKLGLDITPIAIIDSSFILANPSYYEFRPVFPYDSNNTKQLEGNGVKQEQYLNMDNEAHKDSLIGNLHTIKNNLNLLQTMFYNDMFNDVNFDDLIKNVEDNGTEYMGIYITGDSKELLKLKDSLLIHCMRVKNIVVW
jgi:Sigma factor regulator C-terminal